MTMNLELQLKKLYSINFLIQSKPNLIDLKYPFIFCKLLKFQMNESDIVI